MNLHQIKIDFNAEHDRLLMCISTSDRQEVLLWLTRRCVKLLWPLFIKMVEMNERVQLQGASADAKAALLGMEHEKAVQKADFSKPYEEAGRERPLGAEPLLVARMQTRRDASGANILTLLPLQGQGINLALDDRLLHSCCKLLQNAVARAEWDLKLEFPQPTLAMAETGQPRTLN
jgi:hypothetical protein